MMTRVAVARGISTELHRAVVAGDCDSVRQLVAHGHSVDARDQEGCTPFILACKHAEPTIARLLLDAAADLHASNCRGMSGLFFLAANGIESLARDLIALDANVNGVAVRGLTPLVAAVMSQNAHMVRLLVAAGADVRHKDATGASVRQWARKLGSLEIRQLLRCPADANLGAGRLQPDDLQRAARTGDVDLIRDCLESGIRVDARDTNGCTPLVHAARQHKRAAIAFLLAAGANPHRIMRGGLTPLLLAASNPISLKPFVAAGVDLNRRAGRKRITPLQQAARLGYVDVVRYLLDNGADPSLVDQMGMTALEQAVGNGHRRVADVLTAAMNVALPVSQPEPPK